ncbi:MAG: citrate lyase subunit beta / citryl-CoA lyase [Chloroflexi bacterium]|nr:MAG: citrate lyase subunit beta / citryl-CoA lyase [Chloroflexota bacterium]
MAGYNFNVPELEDIRALLYVPGNDQKKIAKAASLMVDGIILDLEDGVADNRKDEARVTIAEALRTIDFGNSERLVRINPFYTGRAERDLQAVMPSKPDAIVVPKANSAEIILETDRIISAAELALGLNSGSIAIIALIESAKAFVNLPSICSASPRVQGLIFGAEDLAADVGVTRTPFALELLYARSTLVMHATAFGMQAIDMVQTNFINLELLETESRQGAELGFSGKQIIHPAQIEIVHAAYTPSPESIERAQKILEGAQKTQADGRGAYSLDGEMVDLPVVKRAETILSRARAAGLIP